MGVGTGIEDQEQRKREFFKKLNENLACSDAGKEDLLVDGFRSLMLGYGGDAEDSVGTPPMG